MKLAHGIPLVFALAAGCYVAPAESGTAAPPSGHGETAGETTSETPAVKSSEILSNLNEQGIRTDVSFDKAMAAAKAADKKANVKKGGQVSKLMGAMSEALGVKCDHCHEEDKDVVTENMRVATRMWNEWVVGFKLAEDGSQLFCDSCHNGQATFLPRDGEMGKWMAANYKDKFVSASDDSPVKCSTCHGKGGNKPFLDSWRKPAADGGTPDE